MPGQPKYDAIVVGSGPNGLAAAITLAEAGLSTLVVEAQGTIGGGMRSKELTLPGYVHDVCSSIHPMGVASPFFRGVKFEEEELDWVHPPAPLAHPFPDGTAAILDRSTLVTGDLLGEDGRVYRRLMDPLVDSWQALLEDILGPFPLPPKHPLFLIRFGLSALRSVTGLARDYFRGRNARALFAGLGAHSMLSLNSPASASFGLVLGSLGHAVGWPVARRGSQVIADSMAARLKAMGGG